jgi:hypothetical protein
MKMGDPTVTRWKHCSIDREVGHKLPRSAPGIARGARRGRGAALTVGRARRTHTVGGRATRGRLELAGRTVGGARRTHTVGKRPGPVATGRLHERANRAGCARSATIYP